MIRRRDSSILCVFLCYVRIQKSVFIFVFCVRVYFLLRVCTIIIIGWYIIYCAYIIYYKS
jgi:hypothetical protein